MFFVNNNIKMYFKLDLCKMCFHAFVFKQNFLETS